MTDNENDNQNSGIESQKHAMLLDKVALEISVAKGLQYLKNAKVEKAIEVFKKLEMQSSNMLEKAATNLSFLFFHQSDYNTATKYATKALNADRYNSNALVNRANCLFMLGELEQVSQYFLFFFPFGFCLLDSFGFLFFSFSVKRNVFRSNWR